MNAATLTAFRPTSSRAASSAAEARETWANGVQYHEDANGSDVYELPANRPGVAHKIEVIPHLFGLWKEVKVTDGLGQALEAHRGWEGFHRTVETRDPHTGVTTLFDPKEQTIRVSTPTMSSQEEVSPNYTRTRYTIAAQQTVDDQGNSRFVSNLEGLQEVVYVSMVREMPAYHPYVIKDDKKFEETTLPKGGQPTTRQIQMNRYERQELATLSSSLDDQGRLSITQPDGAVQNHELFLRP
ncbi:MAG: hypothetical protein HY319_02030 [Armatimonadetes bacterium]|nr:hypothetical protein [Armatimonadota bacterium]